MRIRWVEDCWQLVSDEADGKSIVLATLRNEWEVVAVIRLCEETLKEGCPPSRFEFGHGGERWTVYCLGEEGERLVLHVTRDGVLVGEISTGFVVPRGGGSEILDNC